MGGIVPPFHWGTATRGAVTLRGTIVKERERAQETLFHPLTKPFRGIGTPLWSPSINFGRTIRGRIPGVERQESYIWRAFVRGTVPHRSRGVERVERVLEDGMRGS
jgi:hypothetical protein